MRGLATSLLLLLGVALVGVGVPTLWVDRDVYDTDRWTEAVAPLIAEPPVQDDVADALARPLAERLSLGPTLERVLDAAAREVVATDGFAQVWRSAVRATQREAVEGLRGESSGVDFAEDGIVVEKAALVEALRQRLVDDGVPFADRIPDGEGTIVLARGPDVTRSVWVARAIDVVGPWALVAGGVALLLGVLVARHRPRALVVAGVGVVAVAFVEWLVLTQEFESTGLVREVDDRRRTAVLLWEALSEPLGPMLQATMAAGGAVALVGVVAWFVTAARGHRRTRRNA